jgi:hypothetical protein
MTTVLDKAIQQFMIFAYYTARPSLINPISWGRWLWDKYGEYMIRTHTKDLFDLIRATTGRSSSTGCGYGDYWSLYSTVRAERPSYIVECGSGISTVVIAYAIRENRNNAKFISLEQAEFYYKNIVDIFPAELSGFVEIVLSESYELPVEGVLGCRYSFEPKEPVDFMYIDGPSLRKQFDNKKLDKAFNADVLFAPKSDRFRAILDQRIGTMWKLRSFMSDFEFKYNPIKRQTFIKKRINQI